MMFRFRRWAMAVGAFVAWSGLAACGPGGTPPSPIISVSGTVREAVTNQPIAGATVTVQSKSATTVANGTYSITGLAEGQAVVTITHQGHTRIAQNIVVNGATTVNVTLPVEPKMAYNGNWSGNWANNSSGNKGAAAMIIAVDTVTETMQFTVDLDGLVFGIQDPPPLTFSGQYFVNGVLIDVMTPLGRLNAIVRAGGAIEGVVEASPGLPIAGIEFDGTATPTEITIDFTLFLTMGGTNTGVLTLSK